MNLSICYLTDLLAGGTDHSAVVQPLVSGQTDMQCLASLVTTELLAVDGDQEAPAYTAGVLHSQTAFQDASQKCCDPECF